MALSLHTTLGQAIQCRILATGHTAANAAAWPARPNTFPRVTIKAIRCSMHHTINCSHVASVLPPRGDPAYLPARPCHCSSAQSTVMSSALPPLYTMSKASEAPKL